jgi:hypothetical protein
MKSTTLAGKTSRQELGDDLILRRSTQADAQALSDFNARIHGSEDTGEPNPWISAWTRDLLEKPHPTFQANDFTIVEDTRSGEIVSSLSLISQTWSYEGIEFKVGRPELVGTLPEYRERGLVRAQFELIHQWSAERGELIQAITGIPYYYRLFGYEMAMNLGGGRAGFLPHIPKLGKGETEPYRLRPANGEDIDFIAGLYRQASRRSLISCMRDEALWRYEIEGRHPQNANRSELRLIETQQGEAVGYLAHPPYRWGGLLAATAYEILPAFSWTAVTPSVIRYLQITGESYQPELGEQPPFGSFGFWLGSEHPVYALFLDKLPRLRQPYAWYLRVPDLPAFIRRIAPVLESRLANSLSMAGYSGELKLSFYKTGLRIKFEEGRLSETAGWKPTPHGHSGEAAFPGLTFTQLLFGYRTFQELQYAFPDCLSNENAASTLLEALFPKRASDVWPVA